MEQEKTQPKITGKALLLYLALGAGILMYVASGISPTTKEPNKEITQTAQTEQTPQPQEATTPQPSQPTQKTMPKNEEKVDNVCYQWLNLSPEDSKKAKTLLELPSVTNLTIENNQKYGVAVATPEDDVIYNEVAAKIQQVGGDSTKVITLKSGKEAWPLLVTNNQQQAQDLRAKLQKNNVPGIVIESKTGPQNITFYSTSLKVVQKLNEYATSKNMNPITPCSKK